MGYVRVSERTFVNPIKSITAIPDHYVNLVGRITASQLTETDSNGNKVIKAGTVVTGALTDRAALVIPDGTTKTKYDGIVVNDEVVAEGEAAVNVTVLVHGFVRTGALIKAENVTNENPLIVEM